VSRFDRYLLSQLLALFGFFSLVLVAVYWVNRAVVLFDQLVGDGQTALVFLEFSALTLPRVIRLVLPISAFAATVYVVNRMMQESEMVVLQSAGASVFRLSRAVAVFGFAVMSALMVLTHILVPLSTTALANRTAEISRDATARFLTEGQFMHPVAGITVYIREITETGAMNDLFLSDDRDLVEQVTYMARRALLIRGERAPKLIMLEGSAQNLNRRSGRLSVTRFQDFTFDLAGLMSLAGKTGRGLDELSTRELLAPTDALQSEIGAPRAAFLAEGHARFANPLLAIATSLIGFGALMLGSFSRFGLWRQIALGVGLLIAMQLIHTAASAEALRAPAQAWMVYLAPVCGIAVSVGLMAFAQRPRRLGRSVA